MLRSVILGLIALIVYYLPAFSKENEGCLWLEPDFYESVELSEIRGCIDQTGLPSQRTEAGETALHLAAAHAREPGVVEELLLAGADPTIVQLDGRTSLHRAAEESALPFVIPMLVLHGANVDKTFSTSKGWFSDRGTTALHLASGRTDGAGMVAALLAVGADNDVRTEEGRTALHRAARLSENAAVIDLLIANGSAVDSEDDDGWRAIHFAANHCGDPKIVRRLLDAGADPDAESETEVPFTAVQVAARRSRNPNCFKLILDVSEKPCVEDEAGYDAVDYASGNEHLKGTEIYWRLHDRCAQD